MTTPADPYERRAQMFPKLTAAQIERIAPLGHRRSVPRGTVLFGQGSARSQFYVVAEGELEIVRRGIDGAETTVTVHSPGEFTGEVDMLSGRLALVTGRMRTDGQVIELDRDSLRRLVQTDSELSELFMRAFILRRVGLIAHAGGSMALVGSNHSADTLRLKEFLTRNGHPYAYLDVDHDASVAALLERFQVSHAEVPVLLCDRKVLKNPSNREVAESLGFNAPVDEAAVRDLVIIGAGPAGLAAAVYGASEGLDVLVLETSAPGGQAGTSSKIENYLGFPTGISGQALAGRAYAQAEKFGAEIAVTRGATKLDCTRTPYVVTLADGNRVQARTVVIASGAQYRKLPLPNLSRFEGAGVYYGATHVEAQLCQGEEVVVVGGANSAGQAAVFLSGEVRHVHMLVRRSGLADTMSRYLIRRIEDSPAITLRPYTEIVALEGDGEADGRGTLSGVRWRHARTGEEEARPIKHVFLMTGATPSTAWLEGCVTLDDKGFVKTGGDLRPEELQAAGWPRSRAPYLFETSLPGVFAVGDVRSGSVKRVASAVGEGSICVQMVHKVMAE